MDDTRLMIVQILQTLQNLLGPLLQGLHGDMFVSQPIFPQIPTRANLGDEVQGPIFLVPPNVVQSDYVLVFERPQQPNLGEEPIEHCTVV